MKPAVSASKKNRWRAHCLGWRRRETRAPKPKKEKESKGTYPDVAALPARKKKPNMISGADGMQRTVRRLAAIEEKLRVLATLQNSGSRTRPPTQIIVRSDVKKKKKKELEISFTYLKLRKTVDEVRVE